jgi:hypothetical protein
MFRVLIQVKEVLILVRSSVRNNHQLIENQ